MRTTSQPPTFPSPRTADRDGLVLVGGELSSSWLLQAYRQGIFPWPLTYASRPVLAWFSPDPRGVLPLNELHVSRRLARRLRSGAFRVTFDQDFSSVIGACAEPRGYEDGTWITPGMIRAYSNLHQLGVAHSVEVWRGEELIGGLYGIAIGGLFAGESMFYRERDGSKMALVHLVGHLRSRGFVLFDTQLWTPHLASLGGAKISRNEYLRRLRDAVDMEVTF